MGDAPPQALGLLRKENWTGRLRVRFTAVTPLLITEQDSSNDRTRRSTRQIGGQVMIPPSSVKGMLRSEFEMVTNSRFGVFHEHERRLAHRTSTDDSRGLVPVCITEINGVKHAVPLRGMRPDSLDRNRLMLPAAWVPRYGQTPLALPSWVKHGSLVWAWVALMCREARNRSGEWKETFHYWRVVRIESGQERPETTPRDIIVDDAIGGRSKHFVVDPEPKLIRGWYFQSNRNIGNKHDERIFFDEGLATHPRPRFSQPLRLTDRVVQGWTDLLASYHDAHDRDDIHGRKHKNGTPAKANEYICHEPGKTAWSWHLVAEGEDLERLAELPKQTLCYAEINTDQEITALYPVALSRRLYESSPQLFAEDTDLAPAGTVDELSAADRLFGWVPPSGRGVDRDLSRALRGRVRVGPVRASDADPEPVERGLAILERPRPTQDLFYAAENEAGTPLKTSPGYREGQGLRGRKVYPHQPDVTWDLDRKQPWLLHGTGLTEGGLPDVGKQNAVLTDRVPKGATFECDVHLEDLTPWELGALLFVLRGRSGTASRSRFHKLGGGKPLGFGTVTIEVLFEDSDVRDGAAWHSYFALDDESLARLDEASADRLINLFTDTAGRNLAAYEAYLDGFPSGLPVHYPAKPDEPDSDEDRYEWFVANRKPKTGQRLSLGPLRRGYQELRLSTNPSMEDERRRGSR